MKTLRAELNQPEPYLKSTLEQVAELVKTGRFAMTWTLKPENRQNIYEQPDEQAPDVVMKDESASEGANLSMRSEDDEGNVKMEDVLPS
jgi:transcription initiation factor TFIIF subunit beta